MVFSSLVQGFVFLFLKLSIRTNLGCIVKSGPINLLIANRGEGFVHSLLVKVNTITLSKVEPERIRSL